MNAEQSRSHVVDRSNLPPRYPTHRHDPAFWCSLGRAVATFGFLEEVLKRAVFALTGTYPAPDGEEEAAVAIDDWHELLERSIANTLKPLIDTFVEAADKHPECRVQDLAGFVEQLHAAGRVRNMICHGSWGAPDDSGASKPFYVTGKPGKRVVLETAVTVEWLDQLQAHTCELACEVMNTVTRMGYRFPGGSGPGRPM